MRIFYHLCVLAVVIVAVFSADGDVGNIGTGETGNGNPSGQNPPVAGDLPNQPKPQEPGQPQQRKPGKPGDPPSAEDLFDPYTMNLSINVQSSAGTFKGETLEDFLQKTLDRVQLKPKTRRRKRQANGNKNEHDVLYFDANLEETIRKAKEEALKNLEKNGKGQNVQAYYLRGNLSVTPLF